MRIRRNAWMKKCVDEETQTKKWVDKDLRDEEMRDEDLSRNPTRATRLTSIVVDVKVVAKVAGYVVLAGLRGMLGTTDPLMSRTTDCSETSSRHSPITSSHMPSTTDGGRSRSGREGSITNAHLCHVSWEGGGRLHPAETSSHLVAAHHFPQRLDSRAKASVARVVRVVPWGNLQS